MSDLTDPMDQVDWGRCGGLVPAVVQSVDGEVLMLAYMNREALRRTLETGYAHFYSRSRGKLWMKGEVSGNVMRVKEIRIDCDSDSLLVVVEATGPVCHTGNKSCFHRRLGEPKRYSNAPDYSLSILRELEDVIRDRRRNPREESYTSRLFSEGKERIYKKFGEEAVEVLVAEERSRVICETADLLYHLLVLLAYNDIELSEIMEELRRRRK